MTLPDTTQHLADRLLASILCENPMVFLQLLRHLAAGRPVSIEQLTSTLHSTPDEVTAELRKFSNIEFDAAGNVIAAGLSLAPTPHRFQVQKEALFTWCALDTLLFPVLLGQAARVSSPCPVTGAPIMLTVTPAGIEQLEPASAVVSIVVPEHAAACCDVRGAFCNHVHFFSSAHAAAEWRSKNPGAMILPVQDAYQLGQVLAQRRYGELLVP